MPNSETDCNESRPKKTETKTEADDITSETCWRREQLDNNFSKTSKINNNKFTCINCNNNVQDLYKTYSNTVKTLPCEKCHRIADKYIEFEPLILLVDSLLLSEQAFRHMLYNREFKLLSKLSLILLLLESFALWRKKDTLLGEKGFYMCCLENICDYAILTAVLLVFLLVWYYSLIEEFGIWHYIITLLKGVAIANLSKFSLVPVMIWRDNTTEFGIIVHNILVVCHHLCSLIFVYAIICRASKFQSTFIVLPAYFLKEYLRHCISLYLLDKF